jgi:hypothetical protein
MERVRKLVLRLSNAERVGGRVEILDAHTIILYDCMHWGSQNTDVVLYHYPETQISIKASRVSLSGFAVTFFIPYNTKKEFFWYLIIGFVLATCAYALLRPPWADKKLV